jgi:hypothetical protein
MSDSISGPIMQPCQKLELCQWKLIGRNAQFVVEFAHGGILGAKDGSLGDIGGSIDLGWDHAMEGMRAAGIGPNLMYII